MKTLKPSKALLVSIILTVLGPLAHADAGGSNSGGGASVVCRKSDGTIKSAKFYDLYAAENDSDHPRTIRRSENSVAQQINAALDNIKNESSVQDVRLDRVVLTNSLRLVERDWKFLKPGTKLPFIPDVNPDFLPSEGNCNLETTAYYNDSENVLRVNKDIFDKLSVTDKAALKMHEAIYKLYRLVYSTTTSTTTRHLVAGLFSNVPQAIPQFAMDIQEKILNLKKYEKISMHLVDFIFGARTLHCEDSSRPTPAKFDMKMSRKNDDDFSSIYEQYQENDLFIEVHGDHKFGWELLGDPEATLNSPLLVIKSSSGEGDLEEVDFDFSHVLFSYDILNANYSLKGQFHMQTAGDDENSSPSLNETVSCSWR